MGVTDIVSPILGAGRTMAMNNFQYINPINIYNKLKNVPSISEQFQIPTAITDTGLAKTIKGIFEKKPETGTSGVRQRTVEGVDENVPAEETPAKTETTEPNIGNIVFMVISSVVAVGMISFVVNDMIMHPLASRIIMTIVLIGLIIMNPFVPFVILLYYLVNGMWKYYINSTLPESGRKRIIPYLYGFLPYTTANPQQLILRILLAPFAYNPGKYLDQIKWDKNEWLKTLLGSFPNAKDTLAIGGMKTLYEQYEESLGKMHTYIERKPNPDGPEIIELMDPFKIEYGQEPTPKKEEQESISKNPEPAAGAAAEPPTEK